MQVLPIPSAHVRAAAEAQAKYKEHPTEANKLAAEPEFYDALSNNCTTNIVAHVNRVQPGRVPMNVGMLLPGYADRLAYDLGLLDTQLPFEKLKRQAQIDRVASRYADEPDFSRRIRQRPAPYDAATRAASTEKVSTRPAPSAKFAEIVGSERDPALETLP